MAKKNTRMLTVSKIRKLADGQSYERGEKYYHDNRILEPVRSGTELRAYCQGSGYEPYRVTATLTENGVANSSCTCPRGGTCKHIVALLLTYARKPGAFNVQQPIDTALAAFSKEELVDLVKEMCKMEPDLTSLVEVSSIQKQGKTGAKTYRRIVSNALRHDASWKIERDLKALLDNADELAKTGDWPNAGEFYHAILAGTVSRYPDWLLALDEEGDIAVLVDEAAEGIDECLQKGKPLEETRFTWMKTLLDAVLTDVDLGGIDLAPAAEDALLKHGTDKEWEWITQRLQAKINNSTGWERNALQAFLAERRKKRSD